VRQRQNVSLLMKKEVVVAVRSCRYQILLSLTFPALMQWVLMQKLLGVTSKMGASAALIPKEMAVTLLLMYLAPILIPFLANPLLSKSIIEERASGGLMVTLTSGINTGFLWAVKTLGVFIFCYCIYCVFLLVDVIAIVYFLKLGASLSWFTLVSVVFISPLCALSITVLMSCMNWAFRSAAMISSFLPLVLGMWLITLNYKQLSLLRQVSAATVAACIVLLICGLIVSKVSRARIVGL